jgi:hypothetical protein
MFCSKPLVEKYNFLILKNEQLAQGHCINNQNKSKTKREHLPLAKAQF